MEEVKTITLNGKVYVPKEDYDFLRKGIDNDEEDNLKKQVSCDSANVMALGKVHNTDEEKKPLKMMDFEFIRDNKDLKLYLELNGPSISIFKNKELWVKISKEYYNKANKIINLWKGDLQVHVQKEKNKPVLLKGDDLGFALAPRVEEDDE